MNVTIEMGSTKQDIRIDSEQKIGEGLAVLQQSGKLPGGSPPDYFRSRLNQKLVSAFMTFTEGGIYDGDVLSVI